MDFNELQIAWLGQHFDSIANGLKNGDYGFLRTMEDDPSYRMCFGAMYIHVLAGHYTSYLQQHPELTTPQPAESETPDVS